VGLRLPLLAGALLFPVLVSCAPQPARTPQTATIVVDQLAFGAAPPELRVGDTLKWANHDMFQHSATAKDGQFDVDLPAGATRGVVLKKTGIISYICHYHPGMTGQITVSE
jgi:plastocyanin